MEVLSVTGAETAVPWQTGVRVDIPARGNRASSVLFTPQLNLPESLHALCLSPSLSLTQQALFVDNPSQYFPPGF